MIRNRVTQLLTYLTRQIRVSSGGVLLGREGSAGEAQELTLDGLTISGGVVAVTGKQATLVSGTNIKTVNGASILGSGNLSIVSDLTSGPVRSSGGVSSVANGALTVGMTYIGAQKLFGRPVGTEGAGMEVGVTGGLEFFGDTIRRSAITGPVTVTAGGSTSAIADGALTIAMVNSLQSVLDEKMTNSPEDLTALIEQDPAAVRAAAGAASSATAINGQALTGDVEIVPSDFLPWLARSISESRTQAQNLLIKPLILGDSWTGVLNLENALRGQFGFYGSFNEGVAGGGATTATQHTRYSIGAYNGRSKTLSASGHTVTFTGETGARGEPASKIVVCYRRTPGGGTFQPQIQNSAGTFVNAGSAVDTNGTEGIIWYEHSFVSITGFAAIPTQVRLNWVSGSSEIIAGGMMGDSINPATVNRHGVIGYNTAFQGSDVSQWNTIPQQAWDALMSYMRPNIVFIREFRELSMSTTDWLTGLDTICTKLQTGRKSGISATLALLAPGGSNIITLTAVNSGIAGESVRVKFIAAGANVPSTTVSVSGTDITVSLATNGSGLPTSTGAQVTTAINASGAASALVTSSNGAGSSNVVPSYDTFYPLSCGVGVDFVFVGSHPTSATYESHNAESDRVLRNWCAARRALFVDVRASFPATFQESFARGLQDIDGLHLTSAGNRLVEKTIIEHLRLRELFQPHVFGSIPYAPQFVAGEGVAHSWWVHFNNASGVTQPGIGFRRTDLGTANTGNGWWVQPVATGTAALSSGAIERMGSNAIRQIDQFGNQIFGRTSDTTKTITARNEISTSNALVIPLSVGGIASQSVNIMDVRTGTAHNLAGTLVSGFDKQGVIFSNLPVVANDAAADADTNIPSGGFYRITGSRIVYQKP